MANESFTGNDSDDLNWLKNLAAAASAACVAVGRIQTTVTRGDTSDYAAELLAEREEEMGAAIARMELFQRELPLHLRSAGAAIVEAAF